MLAHLRLSANRKLVPFIRFLRCKYASDQVIVYRDVYRDGYGVYRASFLARESNDRERATTEKTSHHSPSALSWIASG